METKSIERLNALHPLIREKALAAYTEALQQYLPQKHQKEFIPS